MLESATLAHASLGRFRTQTRLTANSVSGLFKLLHGLLHLLQSDSCHTIRDGNQHVHMKVCRRIARQVSGEGCVIDDVCCFISNTDISSFLRVHQYRLLCHAMPWRRQIHRTKMLRLPCRTFSEPRTTSRRRCCSGRVQWWWSPSGGHRQCGFSY